jgi:archaellum component FlaC
VAKFDLIKVEISNSSKKMEDYKQDVEMKQTEIKVLETEIENASLINARKATLQTEIESEGAKLKKQIDTFTSLKNAL